MSGFGFGPYGWGPYGGSYVSFSSGGPIYIPGANYSQPYDPIGGVLGEVIWYTDAQGNETNLSTIIDEQYKAGISGRFAAPVQHYSEAVPEQDGERYRGTRVLPNQIVIPVTLIADSLVELRAKVRDLASALNPKKGMGALNVVTEDGIHRVAYCSLESFPSADPAVDGEIYDARIDLTFRAFDPYWYEAEPTQVFWRNTTGQGSFFPILPVRLGASTVLGTFTENIAGDAETWPIWFIRGPGNNFSFTNETTGQTSTIAQDVPESTTLVIDTRPGRKEVYRLGQEDTSLFPYLSGSLWPLLPGDNVVTVNMFETNATTSVELVYFPRFLGV